MQITIKSTKNTGNYSKTELSNGLTIISELADNIGSYSLGICIGVGSQNDIAGKEGLAHFMEHSAFKRTTTRTSKQIANAFEKLGAYFNAFTTKEITCFYVRAINQHFNKTFELLADIILNTIFIEKEIEKEKLVIIEEIKSYEDDPEEYICDLSDVLLFNGTVLAPPIVGIQNSVNNITYKDLEMFHNDFYTPNNMAIIAAGNIPHDDIVHLAIKYFNKTVTSTSRINQVMLNKKTSKFSIPNIKINGNKLEIYKQIQQAQIVLCKKTNGFQNKERYPLAVTNIIFGDGMSSRLYQELREKRGLAYSIYMTIQNYMNYGSICINAATDKKNVTKTIALIFTEMQKFLTTHPPKKQELMRAKEQLKTATIIELESMSSRMQNIIKQEFGIYKYESIDEIINNIEKVNIEEIMGISNIYFSANSWYEATLLPEEHEKHIA